MSRIKAATLGFELSHIESDFESSMTELSFKIYNEYLYVFDVLLNEFKIVRKENSNYILLYNVVIRIHPSVKTLVELEEEYQLLVSNIDTLIEEYLINKNLIYRKL